uniref:Homeobox domain-containing protein n=1 Tax=Syphacia muris TaxID=451379 RepID=A0A0N5AN19_9BILA
MGYCDPEFSQEQIDCICEALYRAKDGKKLAQLFAGNDYNLMLYHCQHSNVVIRAYLYMLFYCQRFEEFFQVIASHTFEQKYFKELQDLWYEAHYAQNEQRRQKELGAVEKYRLRQKYKPPMTIWDGEETIYNFKENARKVLRIFYKRNKYPTLEEKNEISKLTDLKIVQISNWFKNRRQRDKPRGVC